MNKYRTLIGKYLVCAAAAVLPLTCGAVNESCGRGFGGFHGGGRIPGGLGGQLNSLARTGQLNQNPGGYDGLGTLGAAAAMGVYGQPAGNPFVPGGGFAPGGGYRRAGAGIGVGGFGGGPAAPAMGPTATQRQNRVAGELENPNMGGLAHLGAVMSSGTRAFGGLPSDAGLHAVATHAPLSGAGQPVPAAPGSAQTPGTGDTPPRDLREISTAQLHQTASTVRRNFSNSGIYSQGWYAAHPGAWASTAWKAGMVWRPTTWNEIGRWFGESNAQPVSYDYGTSIIYSDNEVSVDGESAVSAKEYYEQAKRLALAGATAQVSDDAGWLPLGVFGMTHVDHAKANLVFQLAVNKAGIIRGNYSDTTSGSTATVQGSVDKETQRVAWTVGDNKVTVVEAGLYSLTKDEAPALIHIGSERVEQWILVRLTQAEG